MPTNATHIEWRSCIWFIPAYPARCMPGADRRATMLATILTGDDIMSITVRQGDLEPVLESTLRDDDGMPVSLTDATVWLHLYNSDTRDEQLYAEAEIDGPEEGRVRYNWAPSDTDTVGPFNAAWEVVYPDGRRIVFDDPDPPSVEVVDDIAT